MFHVGQEVVCVNDKFTITGPGAPFVKTPVCGRVYTIRDIRTSRRGDYLLLDEIRNDEFHFGSGETGEPGWRLDRFRPVQRKQLPESLTRLLGLPKDVEVA